MALLDFMMWMIPWTALALVSLYAGYLAYATRVERARQASAPPRAADPAIELERINTELARLAVQTRKSLEGARDAMAKGLKG